LRLETFNTFNHTQFVPCSFRPTNDTGGVVADINDPRFGRVIAASFPGVVQLAGKIYFWRAADPEEGSWSRGLGY
jgi:hypothetical protein